METGISVMDAMTKHPVTVEPAATVDLCAQKMKEFKIGSLIVMSGREIRGIITEEDIIRKVVAVARDPRTAKAQDIMSTPVITIQPDVDIHMAMVKMRDMGIRHLPVANGKELLGFVTLKDVLKIEPDLFDLIVERFELREEDQKPVFHSDSDMKECEGCGSYARTLEQVSGLMLCSGCSQERVAPARLM